MRKVDLKIFKYIISWALILALLINSSHLSVYAVQNSTGNQDEQVYECDGYTVTFKIETVWNSGYNAAVIIQNTGNVVISDWYMYLKYDCDIPNMWNASVYEKNSKYIILENGIWNKDIYPDQTASFGFTGGGEFSGFPETIIVTSGYNPAVVGVDDTVEDDGGDTVDDTTDSDEDGLPDVVEEMIGTNLELPDTDGDELTDYQEVYYTLTDPNLSDTDGDEVLDPYEDSDEDSLVNLDELTRGTDPSNPDTDRDDLNDYDEIYVYGTDPLNPDSDEEGLYDGDEVLLGFNPTIPDTDFNGVLDSAEKIFQTVVNDFDCDEGRGLVSVSVSLNVSGNIDKEIGIINTYDYDIQSREVAGLVGVPIEIRSDSDFESAVISFSYDENMLGDAKEEDLSLMWYDEENEWYQVLDRECVVDTENNTISYTTTHFSTYMIVNVKEWLELWNSYVVLSTPDDTVITPYDTHRRIDFFIVFDYSYDMNNVQMEAVERIRSQLSDYYDYQNVNIVANVRTENGIGRRYEGVDTFLRSSREYYTNQGYNFGQYNDGSEYMWSTTRSAYLDSIFESMIYTVEHNPSYFSESTKVIVLIGGEGYFVNSETLNSCVTNEIQIFTVDVVNDIDNNSLKYLSDSTGGIYYNGDITKDASRLSELIIQDSRNDYDSTDNDGDHIPDYYELNGMWCINGNVLFSDPTTKNSDGDGILDGKEVEFTKHKEVYVGKDAYMIINVFVEKSDPKDDDTDDDGLNDNIDSSPMINHYKTVNIGNVYEGCDYIKVVLSDGSISDGGNQGWWADIHGYPYTDTPVWEFYKSSLAYRMHRSGCGVIACTDLELYFSSQNPNYSNIYNPILIDYRNNGCISINDYMKYAEYNRDNIYTLDEDYSHFKFGVWNGMAGGISTFLRANGFSFNDVTWAPDYLGFGRKEKVMESIKTMISNDIPVIFSYHNSYRELRIYQSNNSTNDYNRVIQGDFGKYDWDRSVGSHYMTIIGYVEYYNDDQLSPKYLLKVVSWGRIYYIDYDEYSESISYFSNILEIK